MDNILQDIVINRRQEELAKLDAMRLVKELFADLLDRERDVLTRRFALDGGDFETLDRIGREHKLTRERIRQIENASINKIKKLDNLEDYLSTLKEVVTKLLQDHGGVIRRDFLLDILTVLSLELNNEEDPKDPDFLKNREISKNSFHFLLSKFLNEDFDFTPETEFLSPAIKLKNSKLEYIEDLAKHLLDKISDYRKTLKTEDFVSYLKNLEIYKRNEERLSNIGADITKIFKSKTFLDKAEIINSNKRLYAIMQTVKGLGRNKFGYWGRADWGEINPRTINDKIYLVLKNTGHPLHFTEITQKINEAAFDKKKANKATVHNELILDDRYILTDRGTYGLKSWQS